MSRIWRCGKLPLVADSSSNIDPGEQAARSRLQTLPQLLCPPVVRHHAYLLAKLSSKVCLCRSQAETVVIPVAGSRHPRPDSRTAQS